MTRGLVRAGGAWFQRHNGGTMGMVPTNGRAVLMGTPGVWCITLDSASATVYQEGARTVVYVPRGNALVRRWYGDALLQSGRLGPGQYLYRGLA